MNKNQLIQAHPELKLYDDSIYRERINYKSSLKYHQNEGNTTDHLKIIAPFGSDCMNADFYYFISENEPISEIILKQMGFVKEHSIYLTLNLRNSFSLILIEGSNSIELIADECSTFTNIKTANQLHTLINLLK